MPDPSAQDRSTPVAPVWVVIDEGCQECGVSSVPVGIFLSAEEAEIARAARSDEFPGWRDGGQTECVVYPMRLPSGDAGASSVPTSEVGR
jgi:hypothetical protein